MTYPPPGGTPLTRTRDAYRARAAERADRYAGRLHFSSEPARAQQGEPQTVTNRQTYIMGHPVAEVIEAERLADRLETCTTREQVAAIMDGATYGAFQFLDEKPGYFGSGSSGTGYRFPHHLLRQLRNDPSSDLFDRLAR